MRRSVYIGTFFIPSIQELGISEEDLPRHVAGGTAVRESALGPDGKLHGSGYCDGGNWGVISVLPPSGTPTMREVRAECVLCQAQLTTDIPFPPGILPKFTLHEYRT